MSRDIPERDWKAFRELHKVALERLCEKILAEARQKTEASGPSSHEKYLNLYKLIHKRDREIARAFNDFRRSTAIMQIGVINSMGLLTDEELQRFSPETQQVIRLFAGDED